MPLNNPLPGISAVFNWCQAFAQNQTQYLAAYFYSMANNSEDLSTKIICMKSGTLSGFKANLAAALGGVGQSMVLTVRKNGADTAITFTFASGDDTKSDTTHSVAVSAGDVLTVRAVMSATTSNGYVRCGLGLQ